VVGDETILSMDSLNTFLRYYGRFFTRLFKDGYEWPRDNIFLAFFMVIVPPGAAWLHDPTHVPDWAVIKITGWLYIALFGVYGIYHAIRTPWKLSLEAPRAEDNHALSFKETVQALAVEILDFVYARIKDVPAVPQQKLFPLGGDAVSMIREMGQASAARAAATKYESETLGIYKYKYSRRVAKVAKLLPAVGIEADWFQMHSPAPSSSEAIRAIGDHLMQVADLLPETDKCHTGSVLRPNRPQTG
jgi:hypothetical protein